MARTGSVAREARPGPKALPARRALKAQQDLSGPKGLKVLWVLWAPRDWSVQ